MSNDKIDLISKDIEFVKDIVQDTGRRLSNLEDTSRKLSLDLNERASADKQISLEIARMGDILDKNTDSLVEHMRRTDINELNINELKNISLKLDQRIQPLEHTNLQRKTLIFLVLKICAFVAGLASVAKLVYDVYMIKP